MSNLQLLLFIAFVTLVFVAFCAAMFIWFGRFLNREKQRAESFRSVHREDV